MGAMMRSFNWARHADLIDRGVPAILADTCARTHVWRKSWNGEIQAWHDSCAYPGCIPWGTEDPDWIEYVPEVNS